MTKIAAMPIYGVYSHQRTHKRTITPYIQELRWSFSVMRDEQSYGSIEGQGHFLAFAQGHLYLKIKTCFSQIPLIQFEPNFVCKL